MFLPRKDLRLSAHSERSLIGSPRLAKKATPSGSKKKTAAARTRATPPAGKAVARATTKRTAPKPTLKPKKAARAARPVSAGTSAVRVPKLAAKPVAAAPKSAASKPATRKLATPRLAPEPRDPRAGLDGQGSVLGKQPKPLSKDDIEELRNMLLHKRAEILGDVNTLQNEALRANRQDATGDLSTMPIHMADLGSDNYELEFTLGLIEGERAILKEIDEALERIRNGTYGFCQATGNPIGKARLKAKPWAKYSYEYTLAQERGQARGL